MRKEKFLSSERREAYLARTLDVTRKNRTEEVDSLSMVVVIET